MNRLNAARLRWRALGAAALLLVGATACERAGTAQSTVPVASGQSTPAAATSPSVLSRPSPSRDLSADEAMGGHTLARHVGKTDAELRDRLRRERDISSASTYTDRTTAEAVIGAALSSGGRSFDAWRNRAGRRPNFVLHFAAHDIVGRSIARGQREAVACREALVVLRWDDRRQQFYVLTSYPEEHR